MIYFLVTRLHDYTIGEFMPSWGGPLAQRLRVIHWEEIIRWRQVPLGTWVFTDLERLGPAMMRFACALAGRLESAGDPDEIRIINDPRRVKLRYELLRTLHCDGDNPFQVHRPADLDDNGARVRFPVFLRHENEHDGSLSELLHDDAQLNAALAAHGDAQDLLIVEYCDTRDAEGKYWKHAAFRVGDSVFPHHIISNGRWVTKAPSDLRPDRFDRENEWVRTRPHDGPVRRAFEKANIDYGRIDYAIGHDGRIVVWEINTNPMILMPPHEIADERLMARAQVGRWLQEGFLSLDTAPTPAPPRWVSLDLSPAMLRDVGWTPAARLRVAAARLLRGAADRLA